MHNSNNNTFKELISHTIRSCFVLLWLDTGGFTTIFQGDFSALGNFYDMIHPMAMKQHWIICMTKWFMMTSSNENIFRVTGPLCGEFPSPVNYPHKDQWRGVLMLSLICAWTNGWVNTWGPGDLRHHRAHYDVTVMFKLIFQPSVTVILPEQNKAQQYGMHIIGNIVHIDNSYRNKVYLNNF